MSRICWASLVATSMVLVYRQLKEVARCGRLDAILDDAAANSTGSFTFEELNAIIRRDRESR